MDVKEVDRLEILTLQDNYIDLLAADNSAVVRRALPLKGLEIRNSVLAEHGFSALLTVSSDGGSRQVLFDFGFSEHGAAFNVEALGVDLGAVEALVLSHGHIDHFGGLGQLARRVGRPGVQLVLHPAAFRSPRYMILPQQVRVNFPPFTREGVERFGVTPVETSAPYPLLDGSLLFLGQIPRCTDFETGMANAYYEENGEARPDPVEDDTAIVAHVKGQGLVVLSGCAHSGIVNTVRYAREVTGIEQVFVVMGGFHLSGPDYVSVIERTAEALKAFHPRYIVPTHCTGRQAIQCIERELSREFLLNMVGTKLTFSA